MRWLLGVVTAATLVVSSAATASRAPLAASAATGRIAFVSDRDGNGEIYVLEGAGSVQTRLTNDNSHESAPSWSPDGFLAYSRDLGGWTEIFAALPFGPTERLTYKRAREASPTWSPAGGRLAFSSNRDGDREIYVVTLHTFGARNVTVAPGDDLEPAWSPRDDRIVFVSTRDGNRELYVLDLGVQVPARRLTTTPEDEADPEWSPDAATIVFARRGGGGSDIFTMPAGGGEAAPVVTDAGDDVEPTWSPNGAHIAFASNRGGDFEVYAVGAGGGAAVNLSNSSPGNDRAPDWETVGGVSAGGGSTAAPKVDPDPRKRVCTVVGTPARDKLTAKRPGAVVCGLGGADRLVSGKGIDVLRGGSGSDTFDARDGTADTIDGGRGKDVATVDQHLDEVSGVETVRY